MSAYFANTQRTPPAIGRKGKPNKDHAIVRYGITEAYRRLGGVEGLTEWGREHPSEFYALLCKLLPRELALERDASGASGVRVLVYAPQPDASGAPVTQQAITIPVQVDDVAQELQEDDEA